MHLLRRRCICETEKACYFGDLIHIFFAIGDLIYVYTQYILDSYTIYISCVVLMYLSTQCEGTKYTIRYATKTQKYTIACTVTYININTLMYVSIENYMCNVAYIKHQNFS